MTQTEALRLALEALKEIIHWYAVRDRNDVLLNFVDQNPEIKKAMTAITAIEAALEAKDEPVVWNEGVPAMLPKQKEGETFIVSYEPKLEAKDEPVAWRYDQAKYRTNDLRGRQWAFNVFSQAKPYIDEMVQNVTPLYTTPPQRTWLGLTDEEIAEALGDEIDSVYMTDFRRVEARLKEKNT